MVLFELTEDELAFLAQPITVLDPDGDMVTRTQGSVVMEFQDGARLHHNTQTGQVQIDTPPTDDYPWPGMMLCTFGEPNAAFMQWVEPRPAVDFGIVYMPTDLVHVEAYPHERGALVIKRDGTVFVP